MPCIVCGGPTKENSIICDNCLQKELHQQKSSATPGKKPDAPAPRKAAPPRKPTPPAAPKSESPDEIDFDQLFDNLTDKVEPPKKEPAKPAAPSAPTPPAQPPSSGDEDFDFDLDNIFTESKPDDQAASPAEPEINLDETPTDESIELSFDGDLQLDNTAEEDKSDLLEETFQRAPVTPEPEPETPLELDLDAPAEEAEPEIDLETSPDDLKSVIEETPASDEDILKKKLQDRLKQKLNTGSEEEDKKDSVDDLLDEVLLDEIESVKKEEPKAPPKPAPPKPKSEPKAETEKLLDDLIGGTEKKQEEPVIPLKKTETATQKQLNLADAINKKAVKKEPVRNTPPSRRREQRRPEKSEKKKSYTLLWIILIMIVVGGGGYGVYEFVLKTDPQKVELQNLLQKAQEAESIQNYEGAIQIYQTVASNYNKYPEAQNAGTKITELENAKKLRDERLKKQAEIDKLMKQANTLFKQQRWIGGRRNAFGVYQQVLKLDPSNQDAKNKIEEMKLEYVKLGNAAINSKNYQRAKRYFENVLTLEPQNMIASTQLNMIETLIQQQSMQAAERQKQEELLAQRQKELEQQLKEQQAKLAEQQKLEEQRKQQEAQREAERRKEQEKINAMKNTVIIEALVDGGKRQYVKRVPATYPEAARRSNIRGQVFVNVIVGNDGKPETVTVMKSDNEILSEAAVEAVKKYEYKPPTKDGLSCKMKLTERIIFR